MNENKNINKVYELIDNNNFIEAVKLLLQLRSKNNTSLINYLLGYIHHINISNYHFENEDDFKGSKEDAKRYLGNAIDSENPIEDAFWRLADIEDNKLHSVRILEKGLNHFPDSKILYQYLIKKSKDSDIPKIYNEIQNKNIKSNTIFFQLYEFYYGKREYKTALACIDKIKLIVKDELQLLHLLKAFCFYELSELKKDKDIFKNLINNDVNHKLNYAQYIGILLCYLKLKEINKAIKLIDELPTFIDEPYVYYESNLHFQFKVYLDELINNFIIVLKTQKEHKSTYAKVRSFRALDKCEFGGINKTTIVDLKFARNNIKDKEIFDTKIVDAYINTNQIIEAFEQDFKNIIDYPEYETELNWILGEASNKESKIITRSFIQKLKTVNSWERDNFKDTAKVVIDTLHENKDYVSVIKVRNYFSEDILEKADVLFEVAFAYKKENDGANAKKFYKKSGEKNKQVVL